MKALVLGAGGFLGLNLVDALNAAGFPPRCGRRARSNVLGLRARKAELVTADLDLPPTLAPALAGIEVVFHLAGHYPRLSLDPEATVRTAERQTQALLDAVAQAGVQRLVYVSSTATVAPSGHGPSTERDVFSLAPSSGAYHRAKWRMEQLVQQERRFETVTVCPGATLGAHDWKVGTAALLVAAARGECPPHPDGWVNPVDAGDVAELLVRLSRARRPPPRVLAAGGSYRFHDVLSGLGRRYGPAVLPAPLHSIEALAFAEAEERLAAATGQRPRLSSEIAELVVHGVPIDASLGKEVLGRAWTPLDITLDTFDTWARAMGLFAAPRPEQTA
jgi:dihydroflavonol-4-reductase